MKSKKWRDIQRGQELLLQKKTSEKGSASSSSSAPMLSNGVTHFPSLKKHAKFEKNCGNMMVLAERIFKSEFLESMNFKYLKSLKN